jgi:hypothetical protein
LLGSEALALSGILNKGNASALARQGEGSKLLVERSSRGNRGRHPLSGAFPAHFLILDAHPDRLLDASGLANLLEAPSAHTPLITAHAALIAEAAAADVPCAGHPTIPGLISDLSEPGYSS